MAADGLEWFSAGEKVETCEKGSVAHFVPGGCSASDHCDACRQEKQYSIGCGVNTQNSQSAVTTQGGSDYETYGAALEQRLETILQRMRGVGDVQVMITFRDQGESIVEKDVTMREDTQEGEQKEGETDTVNGGSGSCENSETTVYARSDGDETPFVNRAILPKIDGVLIVAEGGDDSEVRKNISESVEALFGLDAHKIKIVKMKTKGDSN